jgi:hypothetical protein
MSRQNWIEGQSIAADDLNAVAMGVEQTVMEQVIQGLLEGRSGFVADGFKVMRASATTFTVEDGMGLYVDSSQTAPETKFRLLHNSTNATIYTITNPHATLPRIDLVQVRAKLDTDATASRDVKDGVGTVTPTTVTIRKKWTYELQIKDGTAAGSPVAPSVDAGWVEIAEIYVSASPTGIANQAAITDSRTVMQLLDSLDSRLDTAESALISLDGRLDTIEGYNLNTRTTTLETYTAENTLQTADLWEWDLPLQTVPSACVTSVNANSNDLDIKRTGSAGANTWAGTRLEALYGSMLLELFDMFARGLGLQITDASANVWKIIPKASMSAYWTHCLLSGGMVAGSGGGTCTFKLKSTGIGVVYDVYRNGVSQANFSSFVTTTTLTTSTFRVIAFGTSKLLRLTNGLADVHLLRKRYVRLVFGMNSSNSILYTDIPGYKATFRTHRVHRMMADIMPFGYDTSGTNFCFFITNHISNPAATAIGQLNFDMNYGDLGPNYLEFIPETSDFCLAPNYGSGTPVASGRNTFGSIGDMSTYFVTNKMNLDKIIIEEV